MHGEDFWGGEVLTLTQANKLMADRNLSFDSDAWKLYLTSLGGKQELVEGRDFNFINDVRGELRSIVVKMNTPQGSVAWMQWECLDRPGAVQVPFRHLKKKGKSEVWVYFIIVTRLVPENRLNLSWQSLKANQRSRGVSSLEFPRGIAASIGTKMTLSLTNQADRLFLIGNADMYKHIGADQEMQEEVPFLKVVNEPLLGFGYNANTTHYVSTQAGYLVPVEVDHDRIQAQLEDSPVEEGIKNLVTLRWPEETDAVIQASSKLMPFGRWDNNTAVLIDGFTFSGLAVLGAMFRQGELPVTG